MYFLGCVHPCPERMAMFMDPKYVMSRRELQGLNMVGCPITLLHSGYKEAMARAGNDLTSERVQDELRRLEGCHGKYVIGGQVIDYFGVPGGGFYAIFDIHNPVLLELINRGEATGLSLTHSVIQGVVHPYELTLCVLPRRHRAFIYATGALVSLMRYKGDLVSGRIPEPTMVPPIENVDTFEDAMKSVPEIVATTIAARLETFAKAREEAEKARAQALERAAAAEKALQEKSSSHEQDLADSKRQTEIMHSYIADMRALIEPEIAKAYTIDAAPEKINSSNQTIRFDGMQTVIAASLTSLRAHAAEIARLNTALGNRGQKRPQEFEAPVTKRSFVDELKDVTDPRERIRMLSRANYSVA